MPETEKMPVRPNKTKVTVRLGRRVEDYKQRSAKFASRSAPAKTSLSSKKFLISAVEKELRSLVSSDEADRWLISPQQNWEGKTPIEMIQSGQGIVVLRAILRMNEGMPT